MPPYKMPLFVFSHSYCFLSRVREAKLTERNSLQNRISVRRSHEQESCAIAKMTARCSLYSLQRYDNSKLSKMAACRKLGFGVTGNSAIRSADLENPTLEPNTKCIGSPISDHLLWRYGHLSILGHMEPPFWGRGGRMGSAMASLERAMVVSYRLSIVTVALSVTIRPQFAIECLRRSNQQVVGHFGPKIFGCSTCSRPMMFGSAESEHPRLTNGEIISEEFQPV